MIAENSKTNIRNLLLIEVDTVVMLSTSISSTSRVLSVFAYKQTNKTMRSWIKPKLIFYDLTPSE